jgi:hypothetical protein
LLYAGRQAISLPREWLTVLNARFHAGIIF